MIVMSGQVPVACTSLPPALELIRDGRVRALAVTSLQRNAALPDVPTVAEQGFPGFAALTWFAIMAPAGTPAATADRMAAELNRLIDGAEMRQRLDTLAFQASPMTRAELGAFVRAEVTKWAEVVRRSGATAE